jgi:hypothetical protein
MVLGPPTLLLTYVAKGTLPRTSRKFGTFLRNCVTAAALDA